MLVYFEKSNRFFRLTILVIATIVLMFGITNTVKSSATVWQDLYSCVCGLPPQTGSDYSYTYYHYYQHPYWGWGFQAESGTRYWTSYVTIYYVAYGNPANVYNDACRYGNVLFWSAQATGTSYFYGQYTYGPQYIYTGTEFNYTSGGGTPIGTYPSFGSCNSNGW